VRIVRGGVEEIGVTGLIEVINYTNEMYPIAKIS